jgi:hypothetical protein
MTRVLALLLLLAQSPKDPFDTPEFRHAVKCIEAITQHIHEYAVCRRTLRWYKPWHRCSYRPLSKEECPPQAELSRR